MSKHGFVDYRLTESEKAPDNGYVRIKANEQGNLQYIFPSGAVKNITSPWEIPVIDNEISDPSTISPTQWDRYIVPVNSINDWNGHDTDIATWDGVNWQFQTPEEGWTVYLKKDNSIYVFDGVFWKTLTALPVVFSMNHYDIYTLYKNGALIPGAFYKILDYQSNNRVGYSYETEIYTTSEFELLVKAISNDVIQMDAQDLTEPFHEILYDINITKLGYFWHYADTSNSPIDGEYYTYEGLMIDPSIDSRFEIYFLSDKQVRLGTETICDKFPNKQTAIQVKDSSTWADVSVTLAHPDLSFDDTTGILTIAPSSSLTFYNDSSAHYYYISVNNINIYTPECDRGRIFFRKDLYNLIEGDVDWKNYKYKVYRCQTHEFTPNQPVQQDGYYTCQRIDIRVPDPGIFSRTPVLTIPDRSDYVLKSFFENCHAYNVKLYGVNNIVFENVNIRNLELENARYLYFGLNTAIEYAKISGEGGTFFCPTIQGTYVENTKINTTYSVYFGSINTSEINNTHSSCLGSIEKSTIEVASLRMNNYSIVRSFHGRISSTQVLSPNSSEQAVIEKMTISDLSRSYVLGNTYISDSSFSGVLQSARFENTTITKLKMTFENYIDRLHFENLTILNSEYIGEIPAANISFLNLENSKITGNLYNSIPEVISYNFIDISAAYTVPELSIGIYFDSSASSYDIELPANPFENQEIIFIDKFGNCQNNNINIVVSTSPASGIINTINGNNSRIIDKQYGILIIRYNTSAGWIVVQETIVNNPLFPDDITIEDVSNALKIKNINYIIDDDGESIDGSDTPMVDSHSEIVTRAYVDNVVSNSSVEADDLTIETETDFLERSSSQNLQLEFFDNWDNVFPNADWETASSYNSVESSFQCTPGVDAILSYTGSNSFTNSAGNYQLYATIDVTPYQIYLYDDNSSNAIYPASINYINGLYLITFSLSGGEKIIELGFNNNIDTPCTIWLINRNVAINTNDIVTIKSINKIIDSNDLSIDGSITLKNNAHDELVTRDYVDKKISNADEITLEKIRTISDVSTESNMNLLIHNAWSNEASSTNWSVGSHTTYSNGRLSVNIPSGMGWEDIFITTTPTVWHEGKVCKIITDFQDTVAKITVIDDNHIDLMSWQYNEKLLPDGRYEYSLYIPAETNFKGLHLDKGLPNFNGNIWFIILDTYPNPDEFKIKNINYIIDDDGESIDGSDTPMANANQELVTRAFVNNSISLISPSKTKDSFNVDSTIITNNYIDLSYNIDTSRHEDVILNGVILEEGTGNDYTISGGNRINFDIGVNLTVGDRIVVKYYF